MNFSKGLFSQGHNQNDRGFGSNYYKIVINERKAEQMFIFMRIKLSLNVLYFLAFVLAFICVMMTRPG